MDASNAFFKPIPAQVINEGAALGPLSLRDFTLVKPEEVAAFRFQAVTLGDAPLPKGLICTTDGILSGIPAKGTQGYYEVHLSADNQIGDVYITSFSLTIKPSLAQVVDESPMTELKGRIWQALENNLPVPEWDELSKLPITPLEIYYLLERWAVLTIWDVFNLDPAGPKTPLKLEGASPHYSVYDCGSCIVASPTDLFSDKRTVEDSLLTARAMAREVYKRGWTIEFAGFDKMVRASWIELQLLADRHGKSLDILHFDPRPEDIKLYSIQSKAQTPQQSSGI